MRKLQAIGLCLLLSACNQPTPQAIDGDTLRLGHEHIRLWGMDAPELEQTCLGKGMRRYACGQDAKRALERFLSGGEITCKALYRDHYSRQVAQCSLPNGDDIGQLMVRAGWALDYPRYSRGYYQSDEQFARERKAGIHDGQFINPEEFRRKQEHR